MTLMITKTSENEMMNKLSISKMQFIFLVLCLMAVMTSVVDAKEKRVLPKTVTLYEGESKVLNAPNIERMSVGKVDLLSTTLLKSGEVVLSADGAGETNMQVWFADGHREILPVVIVATNGWREAYEVRAIKRCPRH